MGEQFPSFDVYVATNNGGWGEGGTCHACALNAPRLTEGISKAGHLRGDGECEACVRYKWGYDQAEHAATFAMLGGAVKGALDATISPALIRAAVDHALDRHLEDDARNYGRMEATR